MHTNINIDTTQPPNLNQLCYVPFIHNKFKEPSTMKNIIIDHSKTRISNSTSVPETSQAENIRPKRNNYKAIGSTIKTTNNRSTNKMINKIRRVSCDISYDYDDSVTTSTEREYKRHQHQRTVVDHTYHDHSHDPILVVDYHGDAEEKVTADEEITTSTNHCAIAMTGAVTSSTSKDNNNTRKRFSDRQRRQQEEQKKAKEVPQKSSKLVVALPPHACSSGTTTNPQLSPSSNGAFPEHLHEMLFIVEKEHLQHIVSWQPHGRCFLIHDKEQFLKQIVHRFFNQTKLTSFQRQLNLYGFTRISAGRDRGAYYHELFLRGRIYLCRKMTRTRIKGNGMKPASSPQTEPNFYEMEWCTDDNCLTTIKTIKEENIRSRVSTSEKLHSLHEPDEKGVTEKVSKRTKKVIRGLHNHQNNLAEQSVPASIKRGCKTIVALETDDDEYSCVDGTGKSSKHDSSHESLSDHHSIDSNGLETDVTRSATRIIGKRRNTNQGVQVEEQDYQCGMYKKRTIKQQNNGATKLYYGNSNNNKTTHLVSPMRSPNITAYAASDPWLTLSLEDSMSPLLPLVHEADDNDHHHYHDDMDISNGDNDRTGTIIDDSENNDMFHVVGVESDTSFVNDDVDVDMETFSYDYANVSTTAGSRMTVENSTTNLLYSEEDCWNCLPPMNDDAVDDEDETVQRQEHENMLLTDNHFHHEEDRSVDCTTMNTTSSSSAQLHETGDEVFFEGNKFRYIGHESMARTLE